MYTHACTCSYTLYYVPHVSIACYELTYFSNFIPIQIVCMLENLLVIVMYCLLYILYTVPLLPLLLV